MPPPRWCPGFHQHAVSRGQSFHDLDPCAVAPPDTQDTPFGAIVDEQGYDASPVFAAYRTCGHREHRAFLQLDPHAGRHLRSKQRFVVAVDLDRDHVLDDVVLDRRRGVDGGHAALEVARGKCVNGEDHRLSLRNLADVHFVHVCVELQTLEVDDRHERRRIEARGNRLALLRRNGRHDASNRRLNDGEGAIDARALECGPRALDIGFGLFALLHDGRANDFERPPRRFQLRLRGQVAISRGVGDRPRGKALFEQHLLTLQLLCSERRIRLVAAHVGACARRLLGSKGVERGMLRFRELQFRAPLRDQRIQFGRLELRDDLASFDPIADVGAQPPDAAGDAGTDADLGANLRLDGARARPRWP